jgi:phosphatidylinositol alpha-1,6-mannosyltransferase
MSDIAIRVEGLGKKYRLGANAQPYKTMVDGVTGLLVEPTDIGAIADACIRLLKDRDLARRLGAAGRERVRTVCTWEHIARQVEDVMLPRAARKPDQRP